MAWRIVLSQQAVKEASSAYIFAGLLNPKTTRFISLNLNILFIHHYVFENSLPKLSVFALRFCPGLPVCSASSPIAVSYMTSRISLDDNV